MPPSESTKFALNLLFDFPKLFPFLLLPPFFNNLFNLCSNFLLLSVPHRHYLNHTSHPTLSEFLLSYHHQLK